jgi:hypothetical protein
MVGFHKLVDHREIKKPEIPDEWKPFFKEKNFEKGNFGIIFFGL